MPPCTRRRAALIALAVALLGAAALASCRRGRESSNVLEWADAVENGPFVGDLEGQMARHHVPGISIVVVDDYRIAWTRVHGVADAGTSREATPETVFLASSISKAVTAVVALRLVEQGLLDLDGDVNDVLVSWKVPENAFTAQSRVTLRRLLAHAACVNRPEGGFGHDGPSYPTTVQVLNGEPPADNPPARVECTPGGAIRYSNFGYVIVQQLVEDATGRGFPELARELVFDPLGMASSTFVQPLADSLADRAATPHDENGRPRPRSFNPYAVAQGGLWTTPSDLARFLIDVMAADATGSSRILSARSSREMLRSPFPQLEGGGLLGLGFALLGDWALLTAGADPGFRSLMVGFPERGEGVVVMLNGEGGELLQLRVLLNFVLERYVRPRAPLVAIAGICVLVLASVPLLWVGSGLVGLVRRFRGPGAGSPPGRLARLARPLAVLASCVVLGALYPFAVHSFTSQEALAWSGGPNARAVLVLVSLGTLLALGLGITAARAWRQRLWGFPGRLHYSAVAGAALLASGLWWIVLGAV
jgi:CubicO group peptidase (beta-lactamase class C family)